MSWTDNVTLWTGLHLQDVLHKMTTKANREGLSIVWTVWIVWIEEGSSQVNLSISRFYCHNFEGQLLVFIF